MASARPMPPPEPVTTATLPSSLFFIFFLLSPNFPSIGLALELELSISPRQYLYAGDTTGFIRKLKWNSVQLTAAYTAFRNNLTPDRFIPI